MFSDTHFHFSLVAGKAGYDGSSVLETMAERDTAFGQDVGTQADDLPERQKILQKAVNSISSEQNRSRAEQFIHFSAGIWPSPEEVRNRVNGLAVLEKCIREARSSSIPLFRKISAVGECGLDHHWNPSGADGRTQDDFDTAMIQGEHELFMMQLELARTLDLPVIIHSRDAFKETLDCIQESGYDRGVIHCYSYGVEEAKAFLDRGWYISFSGSVTYTKRTKMDAMTELLRLIPEDRILLETDAPYLAPVPMRGNPNTPNYVEYTYAFIAAIRGVSVEKLCRTVDDNSCTLFGK